MKKTQPNPYLHKVKVRLRFRPGLVPVPGELLWADPVVAGDSGGTYSLLNNSFYSSIGVGDIVRATLDGEGTLQVTDIVLSAPVQRSGFITSRLLDDVAVRALGDGWRDHGANWSEGMSGVLVTVWNAGVEARHVREVLQRDELSGCGKLLWVAGPEDATRDQLGHVDFDLDTA